MTTWDSVNWLSSNFIPWNFTENCQPIAILVTTGSKKCKLYIRDVSWAEMPYAKRCNTSEKIGLYIPADKQPGVPGTTQGSFTYSKFFNSTDLLVLS